MQSIDGCSKSDCVEKSPMYGKDPEGVVSDSEEFVNLIQKQVVMKAVIQNRTEQYSAEEIRSEQSGVFK